MLPKIILLIYKILASVEYSLFTNQVSDSSIDSSNSENEYLNTKLNPNLKEETTPPALDNGQKTQNDVKTNIDNVEKSDVSESAPVNNIGTTCTSSNPIREQVYNDTTVIDDLPIRLNNTETFRQFFLRNQGGKLIGVFVFLSIFFLLYVFVTGATLLFFYLGSMFLSVSFLFILLLYRYKWKIFPPFSYFWR